MKFEILEGGWGRMQDRSWLCNVYTYSWKNYSPEKTAERDQDMKPAPYAMQNDAKR